MKNQKLRNIIRETLNERSPLHLDIPREREKGELMTFRLPPMPDGDPDGIYTQLGDFFITVGPCIPPVIQILKDLGISYVVRPQNDGNIKVIIKEPTNNKLTAVFKEVKNYEAAGWTR
jgi:hypothetical protein